MPRRKTLEMTRKQLLDLLAKLTKNYPKLLKNIGFRKGQGEWICGSISWEIAKYLRSKLGVNAYSYSGTYKGRGTEFSGGEAGTSHCWVELFVRIKDLWLAQPFRVIIDGAYAQFFPDYLTPNQLRDRMRLTIFIKDPIANSWYKGSKQKEQHALNKHLNI